MSTQQRIRRLRRKPERVAFVFTPPVAAAVIKRIIRQNALDPRLEPTERYMQRWAGSGIGFPYDPEAAGEGAPKATVPPLPVDEAELTDDIVRTAPRPFRGFILAWYCSPKPVEVIAQELGISRTGVYEERRIVLAYLLGRLVEAGIRLPTYSLR